MSEVVTILSMDPGVTNYAASVIRAKRVDDKLKIKVLGTKMVKNTIRDIKSPQAETEEFRKEIRDLYDKFDCSYIVAERFQTRGIKGKTIESICMMLGVLATQFQDADIINLTASTWKNQYNRNLDLKDLYLDLKDKKSDKEVHELDCTLMGIYRLCQIFDLPYFCNINTYRQEKSFLNHLVDASKL